MMQIMEFFTSFASLCFIFIFYGANTTNGVRHTRNLIWAQTPNLKIGVSRIVGIEGDPTVWVPSGNVQVRHISAPHHGWQFKALAYNWADQTLYWSEATNRKIQGLKLNGTTETETLFTGTSSMVEGLAVDWISNNIYWADSLYDWIMIGSMYTNPGYKIVVRDGLTGPSGVAVHPEKGYLFWTDTGAFSKIEVSDLFGQNRHVIVDTDIQHPRGITIDFSDDTLYWVDSKKDTVECAGFNGNNRRVVAHQAGTIFFGIAVYDKYVFVTEQMQGHLRVYDKLSGNNEINYQLGYVPDGIVMYDETRQPGNTSACDAKGCAQICINDPLAGPVCRCGEKHRLAEDGVSCLVEPGFTIPSHMYGIGDAICQYPVNLPDMSLTNVSLESQCFQRGRRGHYGLAFNARTHELFYTENITGSIGRINIDNDLGDTIIKGVGDVQAMVLDWETGNLFWTDRTYNHISMARSDGMYPTVVISGLDLPIGIAVHPERGLLFWTEQNATKGIFVASMDGSNKRVLVDQDEVGTPNHLYLDYSADRLYWADSGLYSVKYVELNNSQVFTIYDSVETMATFNGISFYKDYLIWTDKDDVKNGIHAARLDKQEKVRGILHPGSGLASQLITFDINNQPEMTSACADNGFCEHICIPTSNETYICACGVGYTLDDNLRTCSSYVKFDNYVVAVDSYQKQIYQLDLTSGDVSAIPLSQSYKGVALDIHKVTGRLYWTDNSMGVIVTSNIDGSDETIFRKLPNDSISDGLAVDHVNQLLFYTCTHYDVIMVASLSNPAIYRTIVNESLDEPRDIIVNSETGRIYWTDWGLEPKIETATMDGGNRSVVHRPDNGSWPNALALDTNTMMLYWIDAKTEIIGRIDLVTLKNRAIYSEPRAHFFGLALLDGYLYVTDWFRKYVTRININGGNTLEQIGPSKFARLNGVAGFKKSTVKTVFSKCLQIDCSNLCLPVSDSDYKCACSDEGKNGIIPCAELNVIDNILVNPARSHMTNERDGSPALTIGLSVLGVVAVIVIVVAGVYIYNKRFRADNISHDRLVEDTNRVDTFYRITFPDRGNREEANFDSGIENPSFDCSIEDVRGGANLVRYSPM
ncbi:low-density lipoprotein receptor-related protein 4-like [Dreissena polymorpha]|uniref:low-density lipoprotein receptor-related protein 4-like n=1 Tax=Dreissena polymorpha TaxID=45954 RepID=UPI0022643018|nr:low-density lipoprotein receptor-related protein 4-like [Dreissena polymorpha]